MGELPASSTYSGAISYHYPQAGMMRRSLPNMAHSILVHEPAKIYPYHLLLITNYRLPSDVDRCNLEVSSFLQFYWQSQKPESRYTNTIEINFISYRFPATFVRRRVRGDTPVYKIRILSYAAMASQWHQTSSPFVLGDSIQWMDNFEQANRSRQQTYPFIAYIIHLFFSLASTMDISVSQKYLCQRYWLVTHIDY